MKNHKWILPIYYLILFVKEKSIFYFTLCEYKYEIIAKCFFVSK